MKKTKEFLKKLAAITLCSIAALQNVSADTEINIDQNTITTVNFDASNPQKATVISGGATREVTGIQDSTCYLYPLDENNFICCNPNLNSYDILSICSFTSTWICDFGDGVVFWQGNCTGYCYFTDNGKVFRPTTVNKSPDGNCKVFNYQKSSNKSYCAFYHEPTANSSIRWDNSLCKSMPQNNNNLNNFNYNQTQVVNSNESQSLFHQTQMPVTPFRNTLNAKSSETTNISPTKKPKTPSLSTLEMKNTPNKPAKETPEEKTEKIGPYEFPAGTRHITDFAVFKNVQPTGCFNHHKNPARYRTTRGDDHLVEYQNSCGCTNRHVAYQDLGGILGWKLARASVLAGYKVPEAQEIRAEWDIYANPRPNSELKKTLVAWGLWKEEMTLTELPKKLKYYGGKEFTEIDKRIFCEIRRQGVPPEWKEKYKK